MGQYYTPILINEETNEIKLAYSHKFGSGLKLMEHSWLNNRFVNRVATELIEIPHRLAWVGDYADDTFDEFKNLGDFIKTEADYMKYYKIANSDIDMRTTAFKNKHITTLLDDTENIDIKDYVIMNDSKHIFLNVKEYAKENTIGGWCCNPLSLLTAIGNGQGGGDYWSKVCGMEHIGDWAYDILWLLPADKWDKEKYSDYIGYDYRFDANA